MFNKLLKSVICLLCIMVVPGVYGGEDIIVCQVSPQKGTSKDCNDNNDCNTGMGNGVKEVICNTQKHCEARICKENYHLWHSRPKNTNSSYVNYGVCHSDTYINNMCVKGCTSKCHCVMNDVHNVYDKSNPDNKGAYEDCKLICSSEKPNCKVKITRDIYCPGSNIRKMEDVIGDLTWDQLADLGYVDKIDEDDTKLVTEEELCNQLNEKLLEILDKEGGDPTQAILDICLKKVGQGNSSGTEYQTTAYSAVKSLESFFSEGNVSVWKNAEGKFNGARLASDLTAGVVLGTVGGVVSGVVIKKKQLENGFDDIHCTVGGQTIADWGDEFRVGLKK